MIPVSSQTTISGVPSRDLTPLIDRLTKRGDVNRPGSAASDEFTALLSDLMTSIDRDKVTSPATSLLSAPDAQSASSPAPAPAPSPAGPPVPVSTDAAASVRILVDRYRQNLAAGR